MTKNTENRKLDEDEVLSEISEDTAENAEVSAEDAPVDEQDEITELKAENAKLKDAYLRAYAESENVKKRCQQEIEKNAKFALTSFAKELLVVADNLSRAITALADENKHHCKALLEGVEMTQKELTKVFNKYGIKKIERIVGKLLFGLVATCK